jgi:xanthine dehydrogenase YagS FAD-binding subunit
MHNFAYARARDTATAVAAGRERAAFLAGGTELINWMRLGIAAPDRVIDITRVDEMRFIRADSNRISIGALSTLNEIGEHVAIVRDCPVLAQACLKAASAQIRNLATIGGNILQKTRCAYFRAEGELPWPCNKRQPRSGCAALNGENRHHAIFGWSDACVATQPSDPAVALAALDAEIHTKGANGARVIPASEFHRLPGDDPGRDNGLEPGELITHIDIPRASDARRSFYLKVRERESYEYATVSVAAVVNGDAGRITAARVALGSVAHKPWRLSAAETALVGARLDARELHAALAPAFADARPLAYNAFKIELARRAAVRALLEAGAVQ